MKERYRAGTAFAGALVVGVIGIGALPPTPLHSKAPKGRRLVEDSGGQPIVFTAGPHWHTFSCKIDPQEDRKLTALEAFPGCDDPRAASLSPPASVKELSSCSGLSSLSPPLTACYKPKAPKPKVHFNRTLGAAEYACYMQHRGRYCDGENWDLDYGAVVTEAREPLRSCRQALAAEIGRGNAAALEAFVASLHYQHLTDNDIDPDLKAWTEGLRVPTSVMLKRSGDCDSKAALFCSLYSGNLELVILRSVPGSCKDTEHPPRREDQDHGSKDTVKDHAMVGIGADGSLPAYPDRFPNWWKGLGSQEVKVDSYSASKSLEFGDRHFIPVEVSPKEDGSEVAFGDVRQECEYKAIPVPPLGKSFDPASAVGGCIAPAEPDTGGARLRRRQQLPPPRRARSRG